MYTVNVLDSSAQCSMDAFKFPPSFSSLIWAIISLFAALIILRKRIWMGYMHQTWKRDFDSSPSRSDKKSHCQQPPSHPQRTLTTCSARGRQIKIPRIHHSRDLNVKTHSQQLPTAPKCSSDANAKTSCDIASSKNACTQSDTPRTPSCTQSDTPRTPSNLRLKRLFSNLPEEESDQKQQRNMDSGDSSLFAIARQLYREFSKRRGSLK